ncbi:MAG: 1-deoxy-D-xylulose-5-phosphate synthase [Acidimicrobiia bacterium]
MSLLSQIDHPSDLLRLEPDELTDLAGEIRSFLVRALADTGGHLSPNLGVVELTLALHRSFASPHDKLIWDVGHQAYVHKLVTGRRDFSQLRQAGGLSGYPSRAESEHDWVESSHASTSISYAMGLVEARDDDSHVVAVIGDGALTGGVAYEALNHVAQVKPAGLIIVINDNGRSYAPTVGGLAEHLSRLRVDRRYEDAKQALGGLLRRLPVVGEVAEETAVRLKESLKELLTTLTFFDVLGLKYTGPIDGHDLALLEETFERAKGFDEPVVIHVVTEKGHGYQPAIDDELEKLHGVGKFDPATGKPLANKLSMTAAFGAALAHEAERRDDVVAITAAMESSTGLSVLAERMPDRVIDVGISEQHAVALAAGLAMGGKHPVVSIYSTFLQRAFDQVLTEVAMHDLPVTFVLDRAGVTGPDGASHHGVFDLSFLRPIPNLAIGAPADAQELASMLATALDHDGPVAIRYPKGSADALPELPAAPFTIGEWDRLTEGEDVLLLATGKTVEAAHKAAGLVDASVTIVNARWVTPMDPRLPSWAAAHGRVVTVEDNVVAGGFGAGVAEALAAAGVMTPVTMLGVPDRFLGFGDQAGILAELGLDADGIAAVLDHA